MSRKQIEELMGEVAQERDEAEALMSKARESLARQASGIDAAETQSADEVLAAATDFAGALVRYQAAERHLGRLRRLLYT